MQVSCFFVILAVILRQVYLPKNLLHGHSQQESQGPATWMVPGSLYAYCSQVIVIDSRYIAPELLRSPMYS